MRTKEIESRVTQDLKAEIYVISHKEARMPKSDIYKPLQVGFYQENLAGFLRDNTGNNISEKNKNYCELTGQYWATYNRKADIKGLVHYRRFFSNGKKNFFKSIEKKYDDILTDKTLQENMKKYDMILPLKRNYFIESTWNQYAHAHNENDLVVTREVLNEKYPDYVDIFDKLMASKKGHKFNMFIARADIFDEYTKWLMDVLFEVEKRIDISNYSEYDQRVFGFLSERLIDVWVEKNNINYTEIPVMFMGKQHWTKKIYNFIKRKIKGSL